MKCHKVAINPVLSATDPCEIPIGVMQEYYTVPAETHTLVMYS